MVGGTRWIYNREACRLHFRAVGMVIYTYLMFLKDRNFNSICSSIFLLILNGKNTGSKWAMSTTIFKTLKSVQPTKARHLDMTTVTWEGCMSGSGYAPSYLSISTTAASSSYATSSPVSVWSWACHLWLCCWCPASTVYVSLCTVCWSASLKRTALFQPCFDVVVLNTTGLPLQHS